MIIREYEIQNTIGSSGGMGTVYRANHKFLGLRAIKKLHPQMALNKDILGKFYSEAKALEQLEHPNVVKLYDFFEENGEYYLVMEFVEGNSLAEHLKEAPLAEKQALEYFKQILDGISFAHEHNIIHRDIKPSNILISSKSIVKVVDFGIAKILGDKRLTGSDQIYGSPWYMAPEHFGGHVDKRSDVYSLGITLFEMLTGKVPFDDTTPYNIGKKHEREALPSLRRFSQKLSSELDKILQKATAKNPDQRFKTAREFKDAITKYVLTKDAKTFKSEPAPSPLSQQTKFMRSQKMTSTGYESEKAKALRDRFEQAIRTLRNSSIGRGLGADEVAYQLPWYLVIGSPGTGKTQVIVNSGLEFPIGTDTMIIGEGTTDINWYFSDLAILLDTNGRYTTEEAKDDWDALIELLKEYRPRKPINGIIICASIPELAAANSKDLELEAIRLRRRLDEFIKRIDVNFPVYLLFTKWDILYGFNAFFEDLSSDHRNEIWGYSLTQEQFGQQLEKDNLKSPQSIFEKEFDELNGSLKDIRLKRLSALLQPKKGSQVFVFPLEFAAIKENLSQFVEKLFHPNPFQESPILRGFYFTSAVQQGTHTDLVLQRIARQFDLVPSPIKEMDSQQGTGSYFIKNLFRETIIPDKDLFPEIQLPEPEPELPPTIPQPPPPPPIPWRKILTTSGIVLGSVLALFLLFSLIRYILIPWFTHEKIALRESNTNYYSVQLNWDAIEKAVQYRIERKYEGKGDFKYLAVVSEPEFHDKTLMPNKHYVYRVKALDNSQDELGKGEISIVADSLAFRLTSTNNSSSSISLRWSRIPGVRRYILFREKQGKRIRIYRGAGNRCNDKNLQSEEEYNYYVNLSLPNDSLYESGPYSFLTSGAQLTPTPSPTPHPIPPPIPDFDDQLIPIIVIESPSSSNYLDLIELGLNELNNRRPEKAKSYFDQAYQIEQYRPDIHYYLGRTHFMMGNYLAAIDHFDKVHVYRQYLSGRQTLFDADYYRIYSYYKLMQAEEDEEKKSSYGNECLYLAEEFLHEYENAQNNSEYQGVQDISTKFNNVGLWRQNILEY